MTHPKNQTKARPAAPNQRRAKPENTTSEGHYQPMQKHLSAKPPANPKSSTHLGITIRWWAAPPGYLRVAAGGAVVIFHADGGAGGRAAVRPTPAGRGGGATC